MKGAVRRNLRNKGDLEVEGLSPRQQPNLLEKLVLEKSAPQGLVLGQNRNELIDQGVPNATETQPTQVEDSLENSKDQHETSSRPKRTIRPPDRYGHNVGHDLLRLDNGEWPTLAESRQISSKGKRMFVYNKSPKMNSPSTERIYRVNQIDDTATTIDLNYKKLSVPMVPRPLAEAIHDISAKKMTDQTKAKIKRRFYNDKYSYAQRICCGDGYKSKQSESALSLERQQPSETDMTMDN